jgi:hypothetical protein
VRGCVDRNLLGPDFYARNKESLQSLRMNCLVRGNNIVSFENLRRSTGLNFSNNAYLNLVTAANFAKTKYANKQESNGTCLPLLLFLQRIKKGSKKFRIRLCEEKKGDGIEKMQVVTTFFRLIDNPVPAALELNILYGSWNFSYLAFLRTDSEPSVLNSTIIRSPSVPGLRPAIEQRARWQTTDVRFA